MSEETDIAAVIDASGLTCPLPLLKAKQGLKQLGSGQLLKVIATDPGSVRDFETFAELSGNLLHNAQQDGQRFVYVIEKK